MVPYDRRQTVLARFLTGQILGVVFGKAAGGALIEASDWRAVFVILGCAYVVVAALLWRELASGRIQHVAGRRKGGDGRVFRQYTGMLAASRPPLTSEGHPPEHPSLMRSWYAFFCCE